MKKSIIVVDGFYNNVDEVRALALQSDFCVRGNYPGLRTIPFLNDAIGEMIQYLIGLPIIYWPEDTYNGAFQYTTCRDHTWIHADHTTTWGGVLYLTPNAPPLTGTAFYRHIETGCYEYPEDSLLQSKCNNDAQDYSKWIKIDSVANIYNRLILFNGNSFHASDGSFGINLENGRLFQTFFFSTRG